MREDSKRWTLWKSCLLVAVITYNAPNNYSTLDAWKEIVMEWGLKEWISFPAMLFFGYMLIRDWRLKRRAAEKRLQAVLDMNANMEQFVEAKFREALKERPGLLSLAGSDKHETEDRENS